MSAEVESLDRGVIEAGITAARALEQVQVLERRVAALSAALQLAMNAAGAAGPGGQAPSAYDAAAAVQARRREMHVVRMEASS